MSQVPVLPGVSVKTIKEIIPKRLYPAGIVGLVGPSLGGPTNKVVGTTSFKEFSVNFGENGILAEEAKKAFRNGVGQVFGVAVAGQQSSQASATLKGKGNKSIVKLVSKNAGKEGNNWTAKVTKAKAENHVNIEIIDKNSKSVKFENLEMVEQSARNIITFINKSELFEAIPIGQLEPDNPPQEGEYSFSGGVSSEPNLSDYQKALEMLEGEPDIDVVYACDDGDPEIQQAVKEHCENMSITREGKDFGGYGPRIGIGSVKRGDSAEQIIKKLNENSLQSDRFVLVAPYGFAGAISGLLSRLNYYDSPTNKTISMTLESDNRFTMSEQMALVRSGILTIDMIRGTGVTVRKGITTNLEQISVQRVVDRSCRAIKMIADGFIGTLNNQRQRAALKERIVEMFLAMEKEGAIVPSTDGSRPSHIVDVYSSDDDFAYGIVHVDIAVRPVRAMDYILATVNVIAH